MLIRKPLRLLAIITVLSLLCTFSVFASTTDSTVTIARPIDWLSTCETYAEMETDADLIVYGTVDSQRTEIRCNTVVFTISSLSIDHVYKGSTTNTSIDVLQTGGQAETITTPVPSNGPLLELGQSVYLYLKYVGETDLYDDYYLIIGGQQGSYQPVTRSTRLDWNELRQYAAEVFISNQGIALADNSDHILGGRWASFPVLVKVQQPVGNETSPSLLFTNQIISSFRVWNNRVGNISFESAMDSSISTHDVSVSCDNFGVVDWNSTQHVEARTTHFPTQSDYYTYVTVTLNIYDYGEDYEYWSNILIHEAGHVLGLADISPNQLAENEESVMVVYSASRANYPTDFDDDTLDILY